jgi:WD40 repeat protein/tRNA A-37 threonylcarbamoyl transferase component Bud32
MLLGQGGFGRTYLATDEDRLSSRCVIKQFSPRVQGTKALQKAVQLFNQEAVRLHELGEHPQIPTLLAYFEQDRSLYLVQQFVEGQNLAQQLRKQGAFHEQQVREVLQDLLPVLQFVHSHQVIHRDITPMNILRRQLDNRLVLIDFGVAKQVTAESDALTGTRIGTEGYAPLEQFRSGKAYLASDLYSLGATCLYLLTETRPDNLYDPLRGRWFWREYMKKRGFPISDRFAEIIDKLLKDLVAERYQSAEDVLRDLNTAEPVSAASAPSSPTPTTSNIPTSRPPMPPPPPPRMVSNSSGNRSGGGEPISTAQTAVNSSTSGPFSTIPANIELSNQGCLYTLNAHTSWVTCVAMSPNGKVMASSSLDDTVKVWKLSTGELVRTLNGHSRAVNAIAIRPDGEFIASGSDDYTIRLWKISTGEVVHTLKGHSRDVNALVISPDGRILASGGEDRTIRLWQLPNGAPLRTLFGVAGMIKAIAAAPNGQFLVSGGFDNKIKIWSLKTGEQMQGWTAHRNSIHAIAISPDSQTLASGSKDKTINIWDLKSGKLVKTLEGHSRDVNTLAFTPDGKTLVSGSSDATIRVWDWAAGSQIRSLREHLDAVNSLAISPNGKFLASASSDKTIKVWQMPVLTAVSV